MRVGRVVWALGYAVTLVSGGVHAEQVSPEPAPSEPAPSEPAPPTASFPPAPSEPPAAAPAPPSPAPPSPAPPSPAPPSAAPPAPGATGEPTSPPVTLAPDATPPVPQQPLPELAPEAAPSAPESPGDLSTQEAEPETSASARPRGWSGRQRPQLDLGGQKEPQGERTHWYGWETIVADASWIGALFLGEDTDTPSLVVIGVAGYFVAAPMVHFSHGNGANGGVSLLMRVGAPLTFVVGLVGCESSAALCGLAVAGGQMIPGVMVLDAAVVARERPKPTETSWLGAVSPWYDRRHRVAGLTLSGDF